MLYQKEILSSILTKNPKVQWHLHSHQGKQTFRPSFGLHSTAQSYSEATLCQSNNKTQPVATLQNDSFEITEGGKLQKQFF